MKRWKQQYTTNGIQFRIEFSRAKEYLKISLFPLQYTDRVF